MRFETTTELHASNQSLTAVTQTIKGRKFDFRNPVPADGTAIHELVAQCPPLDLNSLYAYMLLSEHFARTSVVVLQDGILVGYVSGYVPPGRPDVLFVWQVAVHQKGRGHGLGSRMIRHILASPHLSGVRHIETTVSPSNQASRRMFHAVARHLDTAVREMPLFERHLFGDHGHESEPLLRIGPFRTVGRRQESCINEVTERQAAEELMPG